MKRAWCVCRVWLLVLEDGSFWFLAWKTSGDIFPVAIEYDYLCKVVDAVGCRSSSFFLYSTYIYDIACFFPVEYPLNYIRVAHFFCTSYTFDHYLAQPEFVFLQNSTHGAINALQCGNARRVCTTALASPNRHAKSRKTLVVVMVAICEHPVSAHLITHGGTE